MADGYLNFDTKINTGGFEKGTRDVKKMAGGLEKTFVKLGAAMATAFGVGKIISFAKDSIAATTELENALIGLRSIVEGQNRSFTSAKDFINEYVSDGLIPATQAITAYKNLALRGYDDSQIRSVMTALKDSAAFGRQASYSLGEAVQSAAEGLKNENSILVDNAGVTKNVAKMWDEYAKSIGTTANKLTQQQKIQAEVSGILEETKYQTGDASKVANTYSGAISRLQFNLNNLKVAFGNFVRPIVAVVIPVVSNLISTFTDLANSAAAVVKSLFGIDTVIANSVTKSASDASANVESLNDELAGTKKALKGITGLDELNILDDYESNASSGGANDITIPTVDEGDVKSEGEQAAAWWIKGFVDKIKNSEAIGLLKDLWNTLKNIATVKIPEIVTIISPHAISMLGYADKILGSIRRILRELGSVAEELWESNGKKLLGEVMNTLDELSGLLSEVFEKVVEPVSTTFIHALAPIGRTILKLYTLISSKIGDLISRIRESKTLDQFKEFWETIEPYIIDAAEGIEKVYDFLEPLISLFLDFLVLDIAQDVMDIGYAFEFIANLLQGDFAGAFEVAKSYINENVNTWKEKFDSVKTHMSEMLENVKKVASEKWESIKKKTSEVVSGIVNGVVTFFKELPTKIGEAIGHVIVKLVEWKNSIGRWTKEELPKIINNIVTFFKELPGKIADAFSDAISKMGEWARDSVAWAKREVPKIADAILSFFKELPTKMKNLGIGMINGLIDGINWGIQKVQDFLNMIIDGINSVTDVVGINISRVQWGGLSKIPVPALATGTVVPKNAGEFFAILGDNKKETEIVSPLSTIKQAVAEVLATIGSGGGEQHVHLYLDGKEVAHVVIDEMNRMTLISGSSPLIGVEG